MTNEEMVYYLEHADTTVGQKCKTKTAEAIEKALKIIVTQPKRGGWELIPYQTVRYGYRCNLCYFKVVDKQNFCPNCGADMTESEDKEWVKSKQQNQP